MCMKRLILLVWMIASCSVERERKPVVMLQPIKMKVLLTQPIITKLLIKQPIRGNVNTANHRKDVQNPKPYVWLMRLYRDASTGEKVNLR